MIIHDQVFRSLVAAAGMLSAAWAGAQAPDSAAAAALAPATWRITFSPHTEHYGRSKDHRGVWLAGVERETADGGLIGGGHFRNSFGQPIWYLYPWGGVYRNLFNVRPLFVKWSAGVIYGYKAPYEDKVPVNIGGFTPFVIPALGWDWGGGLSGQLNLIGSAAVMFQVSFDLK